MQATSGNIRAKNTKSITASTHSGGIKIENIVEKCDISATSGNVKIERCNLKENSSISAKSGGVNIKSINNITIHK